MRNEDISPEVRKVMTWFADRENTAAAEWLSTRTPEAWTRLREARENTQIACRCLWEWDE